MKLIPKEKIRSASEGLRAVSHEVRLNILCHLMEGSLCVQELMVATESAQSNLSQHLSKMRMMGLVKTEKRGQYVYYHLADSKWRDVLKALQSIYCPEMIETEEHVYQKEVSL